MKCGRCRLPMTPDAHEPGRLNCPDAFCGATVLLIDAGYQATALPVFRTPEPSDDVEVVAHRTVKQKLNPQPERFCRWLPCNVLFTPLHPHQRYHATECRELAKHKRDMEA